MYQEKGESGPHSLEMRWEYSLLLKLYNPPRELIPPLLNPIIAYPRWENINHSFCHIFKTGLIENEWYLTDTQMCECALQKRV